MRAALALAAAVLLAGCVGPASRYEVRWEEAPKTASMGAPVNATWRVEGPRAQVLHADVHYGATSLASPAAGRYAYASSSSAGRAPGDFTSLVTFPREGAFHLRPHAVVEGRAHWGPERVVAVAGGIGLEVEAPAYAAAGDDAAIAWRANGSAQRIVHLGVHYGPSSALGHSVHANDTRGVPGGGTLAVPFPPGAHVLRMHLVAEDGTEAWSVERDLVAANATAQLVDPSARAQAGQGVDWRWRVESTPAVLTTHTGIHYAARAWESLAESGVRSMPHMGEARPAEAPGQYEASFAFPERGTYHLRAHLRLGSGEEAVDVLSALHVVEVA